ncbi:MAG: ABC transporter permease [Thermoplasmata archaeon]|jgi:ABC-type dipeptide/oligopeptide/nickel transport system permease component|nr:ABC transporter permease [Thermoplasmata archaeon]
MAQNFSRYFFKRLLYVLITIYFILTFNFFLFRVMPADVEDILIPKGADEATKEALREYYGLDRSYLEQYVDYLGGFLHGELGKSISVRVGAEVTEVLAVYVPNTLLLVGFGTILAVFVGVVLGRETAWRRGKLADRIGSSFFIVFYCMPTFLFALVMLMLVTHYFPSWPARGTFSDDYYDLDLFGKIIDRIQYMLLPMFALVIETIAAFSIVTRSSLIDVLTEDYMVTAVAKGLRGRQVLRAHAMPNAMLPVVTTVAINVGWVLSGSIMIEIIFSYQGLGYLTWDAVWGQDYPVMQAVFMLETVAVLFANFIADMMLFKLDPRVKV